MLRKLIIALVIVLAAFFWILTLTVPMVSAAAPAIIAIALTALAYFMWKKNHQKNHEPV